MRLRLVWLFTVVAVLGQGAAARAGGATDPKRELTVGELDALAADLHCGSSATGRQDGAADEHDVRFCGDATCSGTETPDGPESSPRPLSPAAVGTIQGIVTAAATGQPISDGFARLYNGSGTYLGADSLGTFGDYLFGGLAPGTYYVRTDDTDFFDEIWDNVPCPMDSCTLSAATPINLTSGATVTANLALERGGVLWGRVTKAATGAAIVDGFVRIYSSSGTLLDSVSIGSTGYYSRGGLATGSYRARTDSTGYYDELWDDVPCPQDACSLGSGTLIGVSYGLETVANFVLEQGGVLAGQVTDAISGDQITDGYARIYNSSGTLLGSESLYPYGTYWYGGLPTGSYFVRTDSTGYFDELWDDKPCPQDGCTVTSGTQIAVTFNQVAVANFVLATGGMIAGTVTEAATGALVSDGSVDIYDNIGNYLGHASIQGNGVYWFGGLGSGSYRARTDNTGLLDEAWDNVRCAFGSCPFSSATPIAVTDGAITIADFALDPGGGLGGYVTDSVTGNEITDGSVRLYSSTGALLASDVIDYPSGTYWFSGLPAGTYYARTDSTGYADELWDDLDCPQDLCVITDGTPIPVTEGAVFEASFALDGDFVVFSDGFESGTTAAWSTLIGGATLP